MTTKEAIGCGPYRTPEKSAPKEEKDPDPFPIQWRDIPEWVRRQEEREAR